MTRQSCAGVTMGPYDKSKLPPGDLILTNYVRVLDGKLVEIYGRLDRDDDRECALMDSAS